MSPGCGTRTARPYTGKQGKSAGERQFPRTNGRMTHCCFSFLCVSSEYRTFSFHSFRTIRQPRRYLSLTSPKQHETRIESIETLINIANIY